MNTKKLVLSSLAVAVTLLVTNFIFHGHVMSSIYMSQPHLWRSEAEAGGFMHFLMGGQIVFAVFFAWIFAYGYKGTGIAEGVRYGLLVSGLMAGHHFIWNGVSAYDPRLVWAWIGFGALQYVLSGIAAAFVWGRR
jgi:hypothetical protein